MKSNSDDATEFGEFEETPVPHPGVRWGGVTEAPAPEPSGGPSTSASRRPPFDRSESSEPDRETIESRRIVEMKSKPRRGSLVFVGVAVCGALLGILVIRLAHLRSVTRTEEAPIQSKSARAAKLEDVEAYASKPARGPVNASIAVLEPASDRARVRVALAALLRGRCAEGLRELERLPKTASEREFLRVSSGLCAEKREKVR